MNNTSMMKYVCAIDFETACVNRASACAVGLAKIRNGKVADTFYSLIRPPDEMPILPFFKSLHGITNKMVEGEPNFLSMWSTIKAFIGADVLIAHNASFDRSVLSSSLAYWNIEFPIPGFECTLSLSRKNWPFLYNHKLNTVCEYLGIELAHHNALSDALACGSIWIEGNRT
jgi:DNA polymerase III subunit epsilon